ncbi:Intraflagellar transport or IFT [Carpediemonas membranifera]|uniref:Intraflagellar transport or IFT n=1 Tax=Carpediemonas membranifera TaxID=201153 RepID=A0A8J6BAP8_9EUKA|nr:Intraflagellar transport or IFT [Carpediemonas membranifera]|eukprot:KAG9396302.1 Intraflagellar transport or IFT [Carpediemonas membranifera]
MENLGLFFDENNELRIIDPDKAEEAKQLVSEALSFVKDNESFIVTAKQILTFLTATSKQVEFEKRALWGTRIQHDVADTLANAELAKLDAQISEEKEYVAQLERFLR